MTGIELRKSGDLRLKRSISLFQAIMYGSGLILGAGIYVLIGDVAGIAGNAMWISFALAAAIATFTGLSYAELTGLSKKCSGISVCQECFWKQIISVCLWMAHCIRRSGVRSGCGHRLFQLSCCFLSRPWTVDFRNFACRSTFRREFYWHS